jgi:hypothetical protein
MCYIMQIPSLTAAYVRRANNIQLKRKWKKL